MVPNGWDENSLADIVKEKISYGIVQAGPHVEGGIPYIKSSDVKGMIIPETLQCTSEEIHYKYRRSAVHPGDIVFSLRGNIGESAIVPEALPEANLTQGTARISVANNHSNLFYYYQLQSEYLLNRINALSKGSTFKEISLEELRKVKVLSPPYAEQNKIAQILSTWDQAISATEKLLENSQQQKKALMQQLLTGKKRLLDENGVRFSGVWKHIKLRSLIKEIKRDKEENPNNIELLTVKLHNKGAVASGKFPNSTEGGRPYYKRFAGELIIGRQNLHNGGVAIVPSECNGLIASNAISSFEALNDCDINFILSIMSTSHFRYLIDNLTGGTGQKEVSVRELLNVFVLIPCVEEQQKIAKVLTIADQEIETLQKKLDCLKQEKKALMQQLLTGKKRVKVAA
ncbi:restriction endonuclease subunit S [Acinetobacter baumannii]|nr:restriction endonuclease subunit S [Acinetobacter baumannii]